MFNESNTCIKVNHIIIWPTFVYISWHRGRNCVNTLVLIFVIYSMRKVPRCSSFTPHLLTYQKPWNIALCTNIIHLRTFLPFNRILKLKLFVLVLFLVSAVLVVVIGIVVVSSPISIVMYRHFLLNKLLYVNLSNVISNVVPSFCFYLLSDKQYFIHIF